MPSTSQGAPGLATSVTSFHPHLLFVLLTMDLLLVALHVVASLLDWSHPGMYLHVDQGWAERFQYLKALSIAGLAAWLGRRSQAVVLWVWGGLFGYIVIDDSLSIHESYGHHLQHVFDLPALWGLRPQDLGELVVLSTVATVFVCLLAVATALSSHWARAVTADLLMLLVGLALFGVVVDMLHIVAAAHAIRGFTLLEDGGELVMMSLIAAYLARIARGDGSVPGRFPRRLVAILTGRRTV